MKVFNCSTNTIGGAVQNAIYFIKYTLEKCDDDWFYILSKPVWEQVSHLSELDDNFCVIDKTPAKSFHSRVKLKKIVKRLKPDLVYTSAGPAYVNFDCFHVMGCSNPYVLNINCDALSDINNNIKKTLRRLHSDYQRFYLKKADKWILQTELSKVRMQGLGYKEDDLFVIPNSISLQFKSSTNFAKNRIDEFYNVLIPSAYYPHKRIDHVIELAKLAPKNVRFNLTIKEQDFELMKSKSDYDFDNIINLGPYHHKDAFELYLSSDLVFLPSELEVFSTSYIEAMAANRPLLVPRLDFVQDVCCDYPHYYSPRCIKDALEKLLNIIDETSNSNNGRVSISSEVLARYGTQDERCEKIVSLLDRF